MTNPIALLEAGLPAKLESELIRNLFASLALVAVILLIRAALLRLVRKTAWAGDEARLRWRRQVRLLVAALLGFGLFLIWGSELKTVALSLVAFSVALVLATKELILCLMGALLRLGSSSFSVGDRVEVQGVRGDVIYTGPLSTLVLEAGPAYERTGRAVVMPNSWFLSYAVTNETFGDDFMLHAIRVTLEQGADWQAAEAALLDAARHVTARYRETARTSLDALAERHNLQDTNGEPSSTALPRVLIQVLDEGRVELLARVPTRAREKGEVEQAVLRKYLERRTSPAAGAPVT